MTTRMHFFFLMAAFACTAGCSHVSSIVDGGTTDADTDADTDTDTGPIECTLDLGEWDGDFEIDTQSAVAFLAGYTSISGYLYFFCPSCTDLSELICLTSVGEGLSIFDNVALTNLDGLSSVTSLVGGLTIFGNATLTNLDGLSSLTSLGNIFLVFNNVALPDCEACDLLEQLISGPVAIGVHDNFGDTCTPVPASCP